jgi:hypothetical protein
MPVKVFVSSTYVDLKDYRQRVITQLRRASYQGFQEHLPENVRLGEMSDWLAIPSIRKTAA